MFQENVPLKNYSNYKIGGLARYFFEPKNVDETIEAIEEARRLKIPVFILGGGTNILFSDSGFNGLVLKPGFKFIKKENGGLRAGAGAMISDLLDYLTDKSLAGLEWAGGLPGTLGGAIRGNAGCFGGETQAVIKEVASMDIASGKIIKRKKEDCDFGYRSSVFKAGNGNEIILEASLVFEKGDKKAIKAESEKNINYRKERQPLEHPNIGSIFKNVNFENIPESRNKNFDSVVKTDPFPVVPAAHLVSEAGLKGISFGGAMISPKHPNFIVNILNASANDVENLVRLAKKEVKNKFGIGLEEEIVRI